MEYNLYFLNNVHDSMDTVNTELDCFFDLFNDDNYLNPFAIKHIILNLSNCLELLIKYRLLEEHWTLIFSDLKKAKYSDYEKGDFSSVDFNTAISRLENICEIKCNFTSSKNINKYRNRLTHYTLTGTFEQIINDISGSLTEIAYFFEKEISETLPQEAKKDFQDSIGDYRKHAEALKKLNI